MKFGKRYSHESDKAEDEEKNRSMTTDIKSQNKEKRTRKDA